MSFYRIVKQLDGDDKYKLIDSGVVLDVKGLAEAKKYDASLRPVSSTLDEQFADIKGQYIDKQMYELEAEGVDFTDKVLDDIENNAVVFAQNFVNPKQLATPATKQKKKQARFAGDKLSKIIPVTFTDKVNYETDWKDTTRTSMSDDYVGYNEDEWLRNNAITLARLKREQSREASYQDLEGLLVERGFNNPRERKAVLKEFLGIGQRPQTKVLRTERYSVPYSNADEELSMAMLQHSGFRPVSSGNEYELQGTDINGYAGDRLIKIDAQTRTGGRKNNPGLNLAVIQNGEGLTELAKENPQLNLIQLINKLKKTNPNMIADKLLHYKGNPINYQDFDYDVKGKDMIISSSRPGLAAQNKRQGPYDRVFPKDWALVDLQRVRDDVLNKSFQEIFDMAPGMSIREYDEGNVKLQIPDRILKERYTNNDLKLAREVIEAMTNPY